MRKWLHRALKGASLTTALFVFQACYGTPPGPFDYEELQAEEMELVAEPTDAQAVAPESGEEIVTEPVSNEAE
ncbi:MAG: hypothetical protein J6W98_02735 [Bacteroidales bacterium]|nr:hypothetical protein [Bacteroidales bacterium]